MIAATVTGRVAGKLALITGAARGQGRSHALRLAGEGADVIAIDICERIPSTPYEGSDVSDLNETVRLVEALGRRAVGIVADVRSSASMRAAVAAGTASIGTPDIVCANAGIVSFGPTLELDDAAWRDVIDIDLTGVFNTLQAVVPSMIGSGRPASVIITGSSQAIKAVPNLAHYVSAKHGLIGLMKVLALELAEHGIRVNCVHPTAVDTHMIHNAPTYELFLPDTTDPTREDVEPVFASLHALNLPWLQPGDVSNAVLWLASDESRFVTGSNLVVDGGLTSR